MRFLVFIPSFSASDGVESQRAKIYPTVSTIVQPTVLKGGGDNARMFEAVAHTFDTAPGQLLANLPSARSLMVLMVDTRAFPPFSALRF